MRDLLIYNVIQRELFLNFNIIIAHREQPSTHKLKLFFLLKFSGC